MGSPQYKAGYKGLSYSYVLGVYRYVQRQRVWLLSRIGLF